MSRIKNGYAKAVELLDKLCAGIGILFLILMVIFSALQILSRYIPGFKILGMEEAARVCFIWMVAIGMSLGVASNTHAVIDMVANCFHGKARHIHRILIQILLIVFFLFLIKYGVAKVQNVAATNQVTPLFEIPLKYTYSAMVAGALFSAVNAVQNIIQEFDKMREIGKGD